MGENVRYRGVVLEALEVSEYGSLQRQAGRVVCDGELEVVV